VVSFTPNHFTSRERAPGTHWIGGWVGPRAVLDAVAKRKIPSPRWESNPRTPIVQPVTMKIVVWSSVAHSVENLVFIVTINLNWILILSVRPVPYFQAGFDIHHFAPNTFHMTHALVSSCLLVQCMSSVCAGVVL
jgi:hypothetical protein